MILVQPARIVTAPFFYVKNGRLYKDRTILAIYNSDFSLGKERINHNYLLKGKELWMRDLNNCYQLR